MIYKNILNTIGETPSIKLQNIAINDTELYVKAEYFNPASSVKDRLALSIIENAEKNNLLKKIQTVVEATSGNTGIGLAMVCAATGHEIYNDFKDLGLDYWVSGYGTGGTFTGVSRILRKKMPTTKLILTEPDVAQLIKSNEPQKRNDDGSPSSSHSKWNPHPIQGWTTDFIPLVLQETIDNKYYDELIPVTGDDGIYWAKELARKEGIITGVSGGATFAIASKVAKKAKKGSKILCMLPDTAERYMSSILFDDIESEMTIEELDLLNSI